MRTRLFATIAITLVCASSIAGEQEALNLANALGLEQRWAEKITGPAIERYLARLREISPATMSEAEKDERTKNFRVRLKDALSWERVGRNAVIAAYSQCDDETLVDMSRIILKESVETEDRQRAVSSFEQCGKDSNSVINEHLARALQGAFKEIDAAR